MAATGQTINSEDFVDVETVNAFSTSIGKSEIKPYGLASPKKYLTLKKFKFKKFSFLKNNFTPKKFLSLKI